MVERSEGWAKRKVKGFLVSKYGKGKAVYLGLYRRGEDWLVDVRYHYQREHRDGRVSYHTAEVELVVRPDGTVEGR